jgi:2,3-bisphosphoglycerate-independent phosphoglycerate mutase
LPTANTPNLDKYWREYPHALLAAAGEAIGLPEGQMGTSEANHLVIGAGRIIYQNLVKINRAVKNGELKDNPAIAEAFAHVKKHNSVLHIKGILGPGGVHGHSDHIKGLVLAAKECRRRKMSCCILFTDGRDTAPKSALEYVGRFGKIFARKQGTGKIASIGGRYHGMDRDNNARPHRKTF